jgi:hypothetical protein
MNLANASNKHQAVPPRGRAPRAWTQGTEHAVPWDSRPDPLSSCDMHLPFEASGLGLRGPGMLPMGRPGLEPGTPRFSGAGSGEDLLDEIPAKRQRFRGPARRPRDVSLFAVCGRLRRRLGHQAVAVAQTKASARLDHIQSSGSSGPALTRLVPLTHFRIQARKQESLGSRATAESGARSCLRCWAH